MAKKKDPKLHAQAERLKERANAAGYKKQADLARDAGINAQTLGSYWHGEHGMSGENAIRLAKVLVTTVDYLLLGQGPAFVRGAGTNVSKGDGATATTLKISFFSTIDVSCLVKIFLDRRWVGSSLPVASLLGQNNPLVVLFRRLHRTAARLRANAQIRKTATVSLSLVRIEMPHLPTWLTNAG